jgi:hypothetical protein
LQKIETAYDIIETLTELIQTRMDYISESKECPVDLVTPIASVIYGAKRLQIPEFKTALRQLSAKFGAGFTQSHEDNDSGQVALNLVDVLLITPPKEGEIHDLLVYIAEKHNIEWIPPRKPETTFERNLDANPLKDSSVVVTSPVGASRAPAVDVGASTPPPPPVEKAPQIDIKFDDPPPAPTSPVHDPQFDELMERLRKLKVDDGSGNKPTDNSSP